MKKKPEHGKLEQPINDMPEKAITGQDEKKLPCNQKLLDAIKAAVVVHDSDTKVIACNKMAEDPKWKPDIITAPAVVRVNKLGDSGIDIKIMGDTKPSRHWDVMGELRLRIKSTFDAEGIEIPWPHTKVYFGNNPATIKENKN